MPHMQLRCSRELTVYAKLSACSASLPVTGRLLVRVNVTSREDLNWGWKSHSEVASPSQLGKLLRTSVLEIGLLDLYLK